MVVKPILLDVPESFETERLTIAAPQYGEGQVINEATLESLESLRPWMPWAHPTPTVDDSEEFSRRSRARFLAREEFGWRLWLKGTQTLVGCSGLMVRDWSVPAFEIGYWCRTRFEGQGYITEAVIGITRFGFDVLQAARITILCDARNERSAAVARRCGYTLEGRLRSDSRGVDGELRDTLLFSKIKSDG